MGEAEISNNSSVSKPRKKLKDILALHALISAQAAYSLSDILNRTNSGQYFQSRPFAQYWLSRSA